MAFGSFVHVPVESCHWLVESLTHRKWSMFHMATSPTLASMPHLKHFSAMGFHTVGEVLWFNLIQYVGESYYFTTLRYKSEDSPVKSPSWCDFAPRIHPESVAKPPPWKWHLGPWKVTHGKITYILSKRPALVPIFEGYGTKKLRNLSTKYTTSAAFQSVLRPP